MDIQIKYDCEGIDFIEVARILQIVGMSHYAVDMHQKAFENSPVKIFLLDAGNQLVGFGRALSDGAYQAALYDIAVLPQYHGEGFGQIIVEKLLEKLQGQHVILYAALRKEDFYKKFGFGKMRTAMARFQNQEAMVAKGFIEKD